MKLLALASCVALSATVSTQVSWRQRPTTRAQTIYDLAFARDSKRDLYLSFAFDYATRSYGMWQCGAELQLGEG